MAGLSGRYGAITLERPILLVLDFGGTKHAAAIAAVGRREWIRYRQVPAPPKASAARDIQIMMELSDALLDGMTPAAVGISFGGPVEFQSGRVQLSHHVPGWENTPLRQIMMDRFHTPVVLDNDANAAALGEHQLGAGKGKQSLLYVTVSTGVGGGWILDGTPWRGQDSMAGEIGHGTIDPNGPLCLCGKQGCLERFASGSYIAQDVRQILLETPDAGKILRQLVGDDLNKISSRLVAKAAALGDQVAFARLEQAAWAIGTAIGNCANLINPELFVLGGGVMAAGEKFWDRIRSQARAVALPEVDFQIAPATLGGQAPLWGALILAEEILD